MRLIVDRSSDGSSYGRAGLRGRVLRSIVKVRPMPLLSSTASGQRRTRTIERPVGLMCRIPSASSSISTETVVRCRSIRGVSPQTCSSEASTPPNMPRSSGTTSRSGLSVGGVHLVLLRRGARVGGVQTCEGIPRNGPIACWRLLNPSGSVGSPPSMYGARASSTVRPPSWMPHLFIIHGLKGCPAS